MRLNRPAAGRPRSSARTSTTSTGWLTNQPAGSSLGAAAGDDRRQDILDGLSTPWRLAAASSRRRPS